MRAHHTADLAPVQTADDTWRPMRQLAIPGIGVAGRRHGLYIDLFAGGGGASTGIEMATGRSSDIAINHNPIAIATHERNHPSTKHYVSDIFEVNPTAATQGQPVDLLWASPDCRHFSRAKGAKKGGAPRSPRVRSLAWVVTDWAEQTKPRMIALENVPEFQTWGPLLPDGSPDPARAGETYRSFLDRLQGAGYQVATAVLKAHEYGAPTTRERFFLVARRDGMEPSFPTPTHGPGRERVRTVGPCLLQQERGPSVLSEGRNLVRNTHERIAKSLDRYILGERTTPTPDTVAIVKNYGGVIGHDIHRPLGTITTIDHHGMSGVTLGPIGERPAPQVTAYLREHGAGQAAVVTTPAGVRPVIDVTYRMLRPRELAAAQGFPAGYALPANGGDAIRLIGNSVVPQLAAAIVRSNLREAA